jgi:Family of unknown function (DUF6200)
VAGTAKEFDAVTALGGKATADPLIVDLGKHKRKQIKQLRQGRGRLLDEIKSSIEELRTTGNVAAGAQPIIIVVREKRRRMGGGLPRLF